MIENRQKSLRTNIQWLSRVATFAFPGSLNSQLCDLFFGGCKMVEIGLKKDSNR